MFGEMIAVWIMTGIKNYSADDDKQDNKIKNGL